MEDNTKIMIGVGVLGALGLAWYLKSKSDTTSTTVGAAASVKPLLAQSAAGPTSSPPATAQPTQILMTSDGTAAIKVPVGTVLAPTSSVGNNWDPENPLVSSVAGVLTKTGPGTFVAASQGGTALTGSALTSNGDSYPMSATIIVT